MFSEIFKSEIYEEEGDGSLYSDKNNPRVFLEIKLGYDNSNPERIEIELFKNIVPKTVENFIQLLPKYKSSIFHRIVKNFCL